MGVSVVWLGLGIVLQALRGIHLSLFPHTVNDDCNNNDDDRSGYPTTDRTTLAPAAPIILTIEVHVIVLLPIAIVRFHTVLVS